MADQQKVMDFTVLQMKYNQKSKAGHYIYLKEHAVRDTDQSKPRDRTLFVLNIPPYCNKECLMRIFSKVGKISDVFLHDKPTSKGPSKNESKFFKEEMSKGFKVAYIVYRSQNSVQKALKLPPDIPLILSSEETPLQTGIKKWNENYSKNIVNVDVLQSEIDNYMMEYDQKVEKEKQQAKEDDGVPDEDGWVTVTRVGKKKGAPHTEKEAKKVSAKERKKRKDKELLNFYSFQIRESKREHIANLRKKFEEDKQRIELMKASRKFRPY